MDKVLVTVRMFRGSPAQDRKLSLARGTLLKSILKELGLFAEGTALWWDGEPVPSDFPVPGPGTLDIVSTFSGG